MGCWFETGRVLMYEDTLHGAWWITLNGQEVTVPRSDSTTLIVKPWTELPSFLLNGFNVFLQTEAVQDLTDKGWSIQHSNLDMFEKANISQLLQLMLMQQMCEWMNDCMGSTFHCYCIDLTNFEASTFSCLWINPNKDLYFHNCLT